MAAFAGVNIAEWGYVTALSIEALRRSGPLAVGIVGLRLFVAAASSVLSPAVVYRRKPGRLLAEITVVRGGLMAASAVLVASETSLVPLLLILGFDGLISAPYRPAQSALVPALSRNPTELVASIAGLSSVKTLSQAIGAAVGGALLAITSPQAVFAGAAAAYGLATVLVLPFRDARSVYRDGAHPTALVPLVRETARVVVNPYVGAILLVSGLRTFVRGMWLTIAVIASIRLLHAGSTGVGLLMLASGAGTFIAAPLSSRLVIRNQLGTPAAVALLVCGVPLALIASVPVFDLALALIAAWGVGMAVADVATSSMLNRLLDTPTLPRVTSAIESTKLALEGLGAFLGPVLIALLGVRWTLLLAALPLPFVVLTRWRLIHRIDATAGERANLLTVLHRVPCLAPLDMASLDLLIGRLTPLYIPNAGTDIVRQHDLGDRFYVIEYGRADVLVDDFKVGELGPGDGFGERALLRDVPRTATVRSRGPVQLLVLPRKDFLEGITGQDVVAELGGSTSRVDRTTWNQRDLTAVLSRLNLFSHLAGPDLESLASRGRVECWAEGDRIICQGDRAEDYYVLLDGRGSVTVDGQAVTELRPGDQFGEIALLHDVPRSADVVATSPSVTLSLHRDDFLPAVRDRFLSG